MKKSCCVCGGEFACHFDGKPYCNKHYLRMYNNGTIEPKQRERTNHYEKCDGFIKIITKKGDEILVDDCDEKKVKMYSWCISKTGYPVANIGGKVRKIHRYLLDLSDQDMIVDHINGNPLDNRRKNLRICTVTENARNTARTRNRKLPKGVSTTRSGRYRARIYVDYKEIRIGIFDTIEDAAKARRDAEIKYFGDFAPCVCRPEE